MMNITELDSFELSCIIVNYGLGSKVLKIAKNNGISGGTVFIGKGTVKNRLLEFLDLCDVRKEIVIMIGAKSVTYNALEKIDKELQFKKPYHGIAYTTSVSAFLGDGNYEYKQNTEKGDLINNMYNSIFVIVDKGKGELVMDAANKSGARGGTIINARGTGIHETGKIFNMDIEPEKEVVLILAKNSSTEEIVTTIRDELEINKAGNGIIFVQGVNKTYGIY